MASTAAVPDHVPRENVWDNDFAAFQGEFDDPFKAGARLHDGPDIIWATNASYGVPAWIFTRHALIEEGFADAEKFSSVRNPVVGAVMDPSWLMLPVEADAPSHRQYRQLLHPFFTPAAIARRTDEIYALCNTLIDGFIDNGRCEFISEFASILPNAIVISLMGMPQEMLRKFLAWEETTMRGKDNAERYGAVLAIYEYLQTFTAEQQRSGGASELMKAILDGQVKNGQLDQAEKLGIVYNLFVAGLDTVFATFGWVMRHLANDQALQARLRAHPGDIPAAVNEFTRAFGVSAPGRTVAKDMVFHGVPMKKGDAVQLSTALAGRDPRAFADPHVIDIDRKPRHVTFGTGAHLCLGVHLAKREIAIMLERFLARMDNIRMIEGEEFQYHTQSTIGVDRLMLEWDPR